MFERVEQSNKNCYRTSPNRQSRCLLIKQTAKIIIKSHLNTGSMFMKTSLVIANWKMNGHNPANERLLDELKPVLESLKNVQVAICPPFPYISQIAVAVAGSKIKIGAQNLSQHAAGAFTGEVAGEMLSDLGCNFVLVGHSERRALYGETDALIAMKFEAALRSGLTPVLCVGETIHQRNAGNTFGVISGQIQAVLSQVGIGQLAKGIIAYEPVWAIGTGETASPEQAQEVHQHVRQLLSGVDRQVSDNMLIIYGGSVKPDNASLLFAQRDIDGGLIGGASLDPKAFGEICQQAQILTVN